MIGKPYKSVAIQLWAAQMDHLHSHINVTAVGDDCLYVNLESLTEPEYLADLVDMPDNGYETITQVIEFCLAEDVIEIQFYCS